MKIFRTCMNLATVDQPSDPVDVRNSTSLTIMGAPGVDINGTDLWGTAAAELQWSIDDDPGTLLWNSFESPVYLSATFPSRIGIHVAGVRMVRLVTVKADGAASASAPTFLSFSSMPRLQLDETRHIKELAQSEPSGTSDTTLYQPAAGVQAVVRSIWVANSTSTQYTYRLFADKDGTTYSTANQLAYDAPLTGNRTTVYTIADGIPLDWNGSIGIRTSNASSLTFTAYGFEF